MKHKVALVTGGSRGIGKQICLRLAQEQIRVVVNYYASEQQAQETVEEIEAAGGHALAHKADVSNSGEVNSMIQLTLDTYGGLDYLINNSGIMTDHLVEEMTDEQWDHVMRTNLYSAFYACRAAIPHFKAQKHGRIINMSSQAALTGSARHAHYAATKSALLGFTYSLAKELGPYGITANLVSPGRIATEMIEARGQGREEEWLLQTPLRRLGNTGDIANAVAYLVSEQAGYITGLNMHVNGGLLMG